MVQSPYATNFTKLRDKEYFESNRWVCKLSPTGAHIWSISEGTQRCKHCLEVRKVNVYKSNSELYNR